MAFFRVNLERGGVKKYPIYRVVVRHGQSNKIQSILGVYKPASFSTKMKTICVININQLQHWLSQGATVVSPKIQNIVFKLLKYKQI